MQLHKRDVVEAATGLLDDYGIADLSMRRLARELEVSPGALYWHFASKQQLLGAVADRILGAVQDSGGDWQTRIVQTCGRLRESLLSHTDGAELVSASFAAGQSAVMTDLLAVLGPPMPGCPPTALNRPPARWSISFSAPPSTSSPGCSGTPRVPMSARRSGRRIPMPGSRSACGCWSTGSPRTPEQTSRRTPSGVTDVRVMPCRAGFRGQPIGWTTRLLPSQWRNVTAVALMSPNIPGCITAVAN